MSRKLPSADFPRPRIGISSCLLGHKVRFDGGHKKSSFITGPLARFFGFAPVCPEVGIGMSVPREPIRLFGAPDRPRALGVRDASLDVTDALRSFARLQSEALGDISGYIFKKNSPSCGVERVKIYMPKGATERIGTGIYARELMECAPLLPVADEGWLGDPVLCENFVSRVYVYRRWQDLVTAGLTAERLIDFHTAHKYLVMAHSEAAYQRLGWSLSGLAGVDLAALSREYIAQLMQTLKRRVGRKRHSNVLEHMIGYLKRSIGSDDKAKIVHAIEAYRNEEVPLVVPITLLRHYFRRHPDAYMERQHYLQPHPDQLGLRDAI